MATDLSGKRIVVTGGAGFLGRPVCRKLQERGCGSVVVVRHSEYDLTLETDVRRLYEDARPDVVLHLAAEAGGIGANKLNPGRFFYANLSMALHLIEHARINGIDMFVQVGTACAYPKHTPVPFKEVDLWDGYPETTNAPYGIAKKAALVMLDGYRRQYGLKSAYVVPANLYGPGDNFDVQTSNVIPALIRKFMEAVSRGEDTVECWGSGTVSREFLYVDDAAEAVVRAAERMQEPVPINLGTGSEVRIKDLAELIATLSGFHGGIRWYTSRPDGQPRVCLDTSRAAELLGWTAEIALEQGLQRSIDWYRSTLAPAAP